MNIVIKKEMIDDLLLTNDEHTIRRNISDYVLVQHQLLGKQQQVKVEPEVKPANGGDKKHLEKLCKEMMDEFNENNKTPLGYLNPLKRRNG